MKNLKKFNEIAFYDGEEGLNKSTNVIDTLTMDIPLFIRMLEYAKEDAKTDMDLHKVTEKAIKLSKEGTLTMADYDKIVGKK